MEFTPNPKLRLEWLSMRGGYPPQASEGNFYYYLKKPDLIALFNKFCPPPTKPTPTQSSVVGRLLFFPLQLFADQSKEIGCLIIYVGMPVVILLDLMVFRGLLTLACFVGIYIYALSVVSEEISARKNTGLQYIEMMEAWRQSLVGHLQEFKNTLALCLMEYLENRIGRSVLGFRKKLTELGIHTVLEATPYDHPYRLTNGVYAADIAIVDADFLILLDIEIDEIHHFSDFDQWSRDKHRNKFFLTRGWTVVRFSEYEIMTHPDECALAVKGILGELRSDCIAFESKIKQMTRTIEATGGELDANQNFAKQVFALVPDFHTINADPSFIRWIDVPHPVYSGHTPREEAARLTTLLHSLDYVALIERGRREIGPLPPLEALPDALQIDTPVPDIDEDDDDDTPPPLPPR